MIQILNTRFYSKEYPRTQISFLVKCAKTLGPVLPMLYIITASPLYKTGLSDTSNFEEVQSIFMS